MSETTTRSRATRPALAALAAIGIGAIGGGLYAKAGGSSGNVFSALGGPRPLEAGTLQVDDIASDPFGYKGNVTLRAVVARAEGSNPRNFVVVDAREAKICKSTNCAKFYLPIRADAPMQVSRWDEIDVQGELVQGDRSPYFRAASLKNLGPFQ